MPILYPKTIKKLPVHFYCLNFRRFSPYFPLFRIGIQPKLKQEELTFRILFSF